jgi:hypothetical protein
MTTQGLLSIKRTILRPADEKSMKRLLTDTNECCVIPMDIALGIDLLPFKMTRAMMCETAFWAQNQSSYKSAEMILKKINNESVTTATIGGVAKRLKCHLTRIFDYKSTPMLNNTIISKNKGNKPFISYHSLQLKNQKFMIIPMTIRCIW